MLNDIQINSKNTDKYLREHVLADASSMLAFAICPQLLTPDS